MLRIVKFIISTFFSSFSFVAVIDSGVVCGSHKICKVFFYRPLLHSYFDWKETA